eukprot:1697432-Rhodomonas_salina.5
MEGEGRSGTACRLLSEHRMAASQIDFCLDHGPPDRSKASSKGTTPRIVGDARICGDTQVQKLPQAVTPNTTVGKLQNADE